MAQNPTTPAEPGTFMTADELVRLPEDGWKYELIGGRLIRMPPTSGGHDDIAASLVVPLINWVTQHNLGYVTLSQAGYKIILPGGGDTVLVPDLAFVAKPHAPQPNTPAWYEFWQVAPDLVVEVVSPSESRPKMRERARLWLKACTQLVWMIWPSSKQIEVWQPGNDLPTTTLGINDNLDGLKVLPGFSYPVARFFR